MRIVVTDQIYLSEFLTSDQAACVEHMKDKQISEQTLRIPFPYTEADFQTWLNVVEKLTEKQGRPLHFAMRDRSGLMIGACGFVDAEIGKSHRAELGYWVAKPFWGRGIATAVVRKLCDHAFAEFGLTRITACVFASNAASARVLQKCGFQEEGYLRKHYLKDGRYIDARMFALLKE